MTRWNIITGEYPPTPGGVSDYTRSVARALVQAGDEVHVWSPGAAHDDRGVAVHDSGKRFGGPSLSTLDAALRAHPGRTLLQWVPHTYGMKSMNVPLARWASHQRELDVMFHEVAFAFSHAQPLKHDLLAATHRLMARLIVGAASRIFVATPAWIPVLDTLGARVPSVWSPVPSNVATTIDRRLLAETRHTLRPRGDEHLVAHFGTFGADIGSLLVAPLRALLQQRANVRVLLLGRGSKEWATRSMPTEVGNGRVVATGALTTDEAALHLAASDLVFQPYREGLTSKRGSTMASVALGLPIVTTTGLGTELIWGSERAVRFSTPRSFVGDLLALLDDADERSRLSAAAHALYGRVFALEHTIARLRAIG